MYFPCSIRIEIISVQYVVFSRSTDALPKFYDYLLVLYYNDTGLILNQSVSDTHRYCSSNTTVKSQKLPTRY
jgi:hypothetical protein